MLTVGEKAYAISDSNRFVILFFFGLGLMLIAKLVFSAPHMIVILFPLSIMGLYSWQMTRRYHRLNRPERVGDNVYYMGFLFTLVSLGLALYEFGTNPEGIITDFAIALSTTVLGVLGRVYLTQEDRDIDEYEKEARIHLSKSVIKFRQDLDSARDNIREFATATRQILEESFTEQQKQLEQDREEFKRHLDASMARMRQLLDEEINVECGKLVASIKGLAANVADMENLLSNQTAWAEQASSNMSKISSTLTAMSESIDKAGESSAATLAKVSKQIENVNASAGTMEQIHHKLTGLADNIGLMDKAICESAKKVSDTLNTLHDGLEEIRIKQLDTAMRDAGRMQELSDNRDELIRRLSDSSKEIDGHVNRLKKQIDNMSESLISAAKFIRKETDTIS